MLKADRRYTYNFILEYLAQKNMSLLLGQALEKACMFEYTETDDLGIIHLL